MNIKRIKFVCILVLIILLGIIPSAYAKTSVEIKPNGNVYTNKTISEFFDESMAMKNTGECLEGSNVDVHMATNLDWAIVSYFSNSEYGTNGEGKNTGTSIKIDGTNYYSTNGNVTGVMNWGRTATYTSGIISNYNEIVKETIKNNGSSLIKNAETNYVDKFKPTAYSRNNNLATGGFYDCYTMVFDNVDGPYSYRMGIFGVSAGYKNNWINSGCKSNATFRPVINSKT